MRKLWVEEFYVFLVVWDFEDIGGCCLTGFLGREDFWEY